MTFKLVTQDQRTPLSNLNLSFYQRTLQATQRLSTAGAIQPTHFVYRYQLGSGITLATYLRWLKPDQRLYLILDSRSPDDELAKWAHYHLPNVFVLPHYHAGLAHYLLDNIYQGSTPVQPHLPVLLSNVNPQPWHALGALAFQETDLLLVHALQHGQYHPQTPHVIGVHFQHPLPYNCSLHEVQTSLAALCREVNQRYTCFECFGQGLWSFSVYDRATLSQLALAHQSFCFFPMDILSLAHLKNLPETDYAFALQAAIDAVLLQDHLQPALACYARVITLDLALLVPITIATTGTITPVLHQVASPSASLTPLICILNPVMCDSEFLHGCEVIISAAYHHLKIATNVQAYFIHDHAWMMSYLQSLDAFQELLTLGFQFRSRAAVLAQLVPGTVVVHFGFQAALAEAGLAPCYTSSVMMVLLTALRGERLIESEAIIGTALYKRVLVKKQAQQEGLTVNDLLYYRHWAWLWKKYTRHILFARQCLTQQMFHGSKAWHTVPLTSVLPPSAVMPLPPRQPWSCATPVPILYAQDLALSHPHPPVFLLWSKTLSMEMVTARAAFYVTPAYAVQLYHQLILQGSLPLIYDVAKLALKQLRSCVILTSQQSKRLPKRVTLVCTLQDQTVIRIRAKYALQDQQHYALYLRNRALNF